MGAAAPRRSELLYAYTDSNRGAKPAAAMPRTLRRRRRRAVVLLSIAVRQATGLLPSLPLRSATRQRATPVADDFCVLPPDDADISATLDDLLTETRGFDLALRAAPIVAPGFAFIAYPYVAAAFRAVFELVKNAPYVEVDGGQYEINILTPTLIGCDLGVPRCCGAFTPSTRVVSRRGRRGWFLFRF